MTANKDEEPKIIVDSDWKEEARKEKETMDRETREAPEHGPLPAPSIMEVIQMIVIQASIGFGGMQDPHTGQPIPPDLEVAKHYIDLLELLAEKTKGHLSDHEEKVLNATLHELHMAFVQIAGVGEQQGPAPK